MLTQKTIEIIQSTVPVLEEKGVEITSRFYKNLFENHPELLNIFNHANQKKGRQQTALANTVYAAAKHIHQLHMILPAVKQIAHKHRSLGVKAEHYPIVGEHLLLAIKQVLGEAATPEIINAWAEAYGVIAEVFIEAEKELYDAADWTGFKPFKVVRIERESEWISSFYLDSPEGNPAFKPGQYISVRVNIPGETYTMNRQYSLSGSKEMPHLRISVKRERGPETEAGKVSNYLHDQIAVGDMIEISAPAGEFTLNEAAQTPVTFISGGVGITPFMSMLRTITIQQTEREVTFIHATQNSSTHAFVKETASLCAKLPNCRMFAFYSSPLNQDCMDQGFYKEGLISKDDLDRILENKDGDFYVCGPVLFMKAMIQNLLSLGVEKEKIHYEFFGPAMDLKTDAHTVS
ncbi:NO-inducible flavohemoprotein [Peribacillus frigoritolerans]|uniref:NO-inducible flavohemoprotein n=1 Tax=Peribacillus frigoritolerans TaxID=450367 RepID=UPI00105A6074|nr:NO-inducible flavohemoprotein [Peribacillus frigoritolerans]TDL80880.1 NO-inducible flavohemoprotein [Peribacillus frigoritolerans]